MTIGPKPKPRSYLEAASAFASGADDPRAFLDRCLAEYEAREPRLKAFVTVNLEGARAAADQSAARWKAGKPLSPIDGIPVGVKDVIETVDMPTGMGSPLYDGWRSERDSATVRALREAGAAIVGKTVTTEFAASKPGPTCNPHDPFRTPGGSSSGSAAAVGAGILPIGLGTQVVGSIIRPASYCGCWGYKPSLGGMNRGGSHDYMSQSCVGVLAATRMDAWQTVYEIVRRAGGDPGYRGVVGPDKTPQSAKPSRLALLQTTGWRMATEGAKAAFENALDVLRKAGVEVVTRESDADVAKVDELIAESLQLTRTINAWESRWPLNVYYVRDASKLSSFMIERLQAAESMTADDYRKALVRRDEIRKIHQGLQSKAIACVTLSAPDIAPLGLDSTGDASFAVPASLLGAPALSLPVMQLDGLPLGLQLIGFLDADADLFAAAGGVEEILGATP